MARICCIDVFGDDPEMFAWQRWCHRGVDLYNMFHYPERKSPVVVDVLNPWTEDPICRGVVTKYFEGANSEWELDAVVVDSGGILRRAEARWCEMVPREKL